MRVVYECEGCVLDHKCILVGEIKPDMCVLSGTPCRGYWREPMKIELKRLKEGDNPRVKLFDSEEEKERMKNAMQHILKKVDTTR
jgi:hypothetical protein